MKIHLELIQVFLTCMLGSDAIRELSNRKKYETATSTNKSESDSSQINPIMSSYENNTENKSKTRILTQEGLDNQIKYYIAPLITQIEDLTQMIQLMFTDHLPNLFPKACCSVSSCSAGPSLDSVSPIKMYDPNVMSLFFSDEQFIIRHYLDVRRNKTPDHNQHFFIIQFCYEGLLKE